MIGRTLMARLSSAVRAEARSEWLRVVKKTVGRFARGNISAQNGRILMPEELDAETKRARAINSKWRDRVQSSR
jgi:hypothetical protein